MNTLEIDIILRNDKRMTTVFKGAYAYEKLRFKHCSTRDTFVTLIRQTYLACTGSSYI